MATRGRPRKMKQLELPTLENPNIDQGENVMADEKKIKIMARGINKKGMFGAEGDIPNEIVEQQVNEYLVAGYKLMQVYMVGNTPDLINLLFILTKE